MSLVPILDCCFSDHVRYRSHHHNSFDERFGIRTPILVIGWRLVGLLGMECKADDSGMMSISTRIATLRAAVHDSSKAFVTTNPLVIPAQPWGILERLDGMHVVSMLELTESEVLVGRSGGCHIRYSHDAKVSSMHCCLYKSAAGQVWVEDLSANGVFVNGARVGKGHKLRLHHLDEITLLKPRVPGGDPPPYLFRLHLAESFAMAPVAAQATPRHNTSTLNRLGSQRTTMQGGQTTSVASPQLVMATSPPLHQHTSTVPSVPSIDHHRPDTHTPNSLQRWLLRTEI